MPGPVHGWLLAQDNRGNSFEIINQARTAAYLSNSDLALDEISVCDVLDFGGCETYALGPDTVVATGGHIDLPGSAGNYATIPSGAIPSGSGDITVAVAVAADDWTPSSIQTMAAHWASGQASWSFDLLTTGALRWLTSVDGTATTTTHTSSVNLSTTPAGTKLSVAATFDADNGASGRSTRFWTSTNGATWTQLGTTQTTAATTTLHGSTAPWTVGAIAGGVSAPFGGNVYDVSIRDGIGASGTVGGTEVFHFDGDHDLVGYVDATDPIIVTSSGQPMTIHMAGTPHSTPHPASTRCDLVPLIFDEPSTDGCPWYNANYPESCDALGIYVGEWTGLDESHVKRNTGTIGGFGGGTQMGVVSAEGRTMALNIMLFARSEAAMDYLFRWLGATLNSVCSTCETDTMLIRRFCGDITDPWNGVAELRRVGIVQGLKWESDVGTRARCKIRRASFTLMAGDPCMYLPDQAATITDDYDADLSAYFVAHPPSPSRALCRPSCNELSADARLSRSFEVAPMAAMAPVVTWTNNTTGYTYPFRAVVYAGERATDDPNPCGMPILGELYVRSLPAFSAMRWDVTGRTVEFRDSSTGGWTPTWVYVEANDPPQRRFFALPCGTAHLVIEPASLCAQHVSGTEYTLDGITFDPPVYPDVDIVLSERVSCP